MATWPESLPAPLVDGYGIEPVDQTVGTDMEVGTQRVRRRSFAQVDTVRFAVNLSDAQMALFRAWFYLADGADGGAGWFTISLWIGRGGGSPIECRFKGAPKWDMTGNHRWLVTGQLEARPYAAQWWDYFAAAEIPSLDLNFAEGSYSYFDGMRTQATSDPFADFITFTRSTTASYMGADGLLKTAGIDEPRIEYDPVTGECKGLLIEESRTNLLKYSEDFDNAAWTKTQANITPNVITSPDDLIAGDLLAPTTGATYANIVSASVAQARSGTYTGSVYIKSAGYRYAQVAIIAYSGNEVIGLVDLETGATTVSNKGSASGSTIEVLRIGNGWWKVSISGIPKIDDGTTGIALRVSPASSLLSVMFTASDGTSGLYIWGAQLEVGSFPTSYIKTEESAVTRGADNASVTGANFSSWYRRDEGTFLIDWNIFDSNISRIFAVTDGSLVSNSLFLSQGSAGETHYWQGYSGSSLQWSTLVDAPDGGRWAGAYKRNDTGSSSNGSIVTVDTTCEVPAGVNRLTIGDALNNLNGHISRLTYWPKRLSNAKLQELSA